MTDDRERLTAADRAVLGLIGDLLKQSGLQMPEPPKNTQDNNGRQDR